VVIAIQALNGLIRALEELVPDETDANLQPRLTLSALHLAPSGVGGYVGMSADPRGEIHAQRLAASVRITVRAGDADGIGAAMTRVNQALLGANRGDLRGRGILRLGLEQLGETSLVGSGPGQVAQRDLNFSLLYEFLQLPTDDGEGTIARVPLEIDLGGANTRVLYASQFASDPLSLFDIIDDAAATTAAPSLWAYNAAEQRIEQRSAIRGGSTAPNANKPGTYLVLRSGATRPPVQDFLLQAEMSSGDDRGLGLVFRFQDAANFGFFLMNQGDGYRMLGKKSGGTFALLETSAVDATAGYDVNQLHDVKLVAEGRALRVYLDGNLILQGEDASLVRAGRVGLVCQGNDQANFSMLRLTRL
jgi:hypothetical protein